MVRTAVKTLTLNVYAIPLPAVHEFVTARPAAAYFVELAAYVTEQCRVRAGVLPPVCGCRVPGQRGGSGSW